MNKVESNLVVTDRDRRLSMGLLEIFSSCSKDKEELRQVKNIASESLKIGKLNRSGHLSYLNLLRIASEKGIIKKEIVVKEFVRGLANFKGFCENNGVDIEEITYLIVEEVKSEISAFETAKCKLRPEKLKQFDTKSLERAKGILENLFRKLDEIIKARDVDSLSSGRKETLQMTQTRAEAILKVVGKTLKNGEEIYYEMLGAKEEKRYVGAKTQVFINQFKELIFKLVIGMNAINYSSPVNVGDYGQMGMNYEVRNSRKGIDKIVSNEGQVTVYDASFEGKDKKDIPLSELIKLNRGLFG